MSHKHQRHIDEAIRGAGLGDPRKWPSDTWMRYLDGWAEARIGLKPPPERDRDTHARRVGGFVAHFLDASDDIEARKAGHAQP